MFPLKHGQSLPSALTLVFFIQVHQLIVSQMMVLVSPCCACVKVQVSSIRMSITKGRQKTDNLLICTKKCLCCFNIHLYWADTMCFVRLLLLEFTAGSSLEWRNIKLLQYLLYVNFLFILNYCYTSANMKSVYFLVLCFSRSQRKSQLIPSQLYWE